MNAPRTPLAPSGCQRVQAGPSLQSLVDSAPPGASLCLAAGVYTGPLELHRPVTLWGPSNAVIRSTGQGTTVSIGGPGVSLLGMTIDGSGQHFDTEDAAIHVRADDTRIEGVRIVRATFGILVDAARRVTIAGNLVVGSGEPALGLRGDGIRLWETRDSSVEGNVVRDARDVVMWYSPHNRIVGNTVINGRYGTHLMYSSDILLAQNRFVGNIVGVFAMYSTNVEIARNVIADCSGTGAMGLGLKESGNVDAHENVFVHDTVGIYSDSSPLHPDERNVVRGSVFRLDGVAVRFHGEHGANTLVGNSFRDNDVQVEVEGGGDLLNVPFTGNDFDDYAGYDLDGDGFGDVAYQLRSLASDLVSRASDVSVFRGSIAFGLMDAIARLVPLFAPQLIVVDPHPRMRALDVRSLHAG